MPDKREQHPIYRVLEIVIRSAGGMRRAANDESLPPELVREYFDNDSLVINASEELQRLLLEGLTITQLLLLVQTLIMHFEDTSTAKGEDSLRQFLGIVAGAVLRDESYSGRLLTDEDEAED